jgi:hypothetical protein
MIEEEIEEIPRSPEISPQVEVETSLADTEWYAAIIDDYVAFELKARSLTEAEIKELYDVNTMTVFDKALMEKAACIEYKEMITHLQQFSKEPKKDLKPIVHALYDINGDGILELIIGIDGEIYGIYALQNGEPASVFQRWWRAYLKLGIDDAGRCVIFHYWGKMDYYEYYFYAIDENGELEILDILYINGRNHEGYIDDEYGYYYAKDVDGEMVDITEEEYNHLYQKHFATELDSFEWEPVLKHESDF